MNKAAQTNAFMAAARERTLLFDGAMGTILMQQGLKGNCPDFWSVEYPDAIFAVHRAYVDMGVDAIETNTFGSNTVKLRKSGLSERAQEIITTAVELARKAADGKAFLNGAVGPTGELLQPLGSLSREEAFDTYYEHIETLIEAGVDTILIESMVDSAQTRIAILAANAVRDKKGYFPVLVSHSFNVDGRTLMGNTPEAIACMAEHLGADLVGMNCSAGPNELFETFVKLLKSCSLPVFAMPNAGLPFIENGETKFPFSSDDMQKAMLPYLQNGAHIGGCCGTTPAHIAALRKLIDQSNRAFMPRTDISEIFCSTRHCAALADLKGASVIDLSKLTTEDAISTIVEIEDELAIIDLGSLSKKETASVLSEALPVLSGTMLAFYTHSAEQAEAALWHYDGIAAVHPVDDALATASVLKKYGALQF